MSNLPDDVGGAAIRAAGDVPEPPVSPPVLGAPERAPASAPSDQSRPYSVEELKTLPLQALLVRSGALTIQQLSEALRVNVATGRSVEEVAVERGWVSAEQVARVVAAKQAVTGDAAPSGPAVPAAPVRAVPAPAVPSHVEQQPTEDTSVGVFLNLTDGQRLWVGRFRTEADAERRAQEVINAFVRPRPGVWPRFGGRFVRPQAVVSVELSRRRDD
jgi:hypothetical protein